MKKNFVSASQESIRMFKSDLLEPLSKVHFSVPLIIYVPVVLYFAWQGLFFSGLSVLLFVGLFLGGLFFWTLTEYVMHRFVFHQELKGELGERIHFIFHGVHHDYPNDALRLVMPPSVSIPLATGFYFLFKAVLPENFENPSFSGFMLGYLFYDMTHYAIHHFNIQNSFWKTIKDHHMRHHYADPHKGYGVSSPFWDKVFGSDFERK